MFYFTYLKIFNIHTCICYILIKSAFHSVPSVSPHQLHPNVSYTLFLNIYWAHLLCIYVYGFETISGGMGNLLEPEETDSSPQQSSVASCVRPEHLARFILFKSCHVVPAAVFDLCCPVQQILFHCRWLFLLALTVFLTPSSAISPTH